MDLKRLSDAREFLARAEGFLLEHEAEHGMILGLSAGLLHGEWTEHQPYLAVVEEGPEVVLVALRTPPFHLVLSRSAVPQALDLVLRDLAPSLGIVGGVNGPAEVSKAFAERWRAATGGRVELRMAQRIYQLGQVTPASRAEGRLRRVEVADRDLVVDWRLSFQRTGLGGTRADAEAVFDRSLRADPGAESLYLWEVGYRPVADSSLYSFHSGRA